MALEYDGHRIGAMQYNGVTIGEAMIDGQIVYRSVIRVTPVAPTFHEGEPWYTLPTVEGVTYSVSGTPGYDASVTVTATAQPGYELVGTASWSHTYGPAPSIYPISETWGPTTIPARRTVMAGTHTIAESGNYTLALTSHAGTPGGVEIATAAPPPAGWVHSDPPPQTSTTRNLTAGVTIYFRVIGGAFQTTASGTWSIVKN